MDELNEMIGLGAVKRQLRTLLNTIKVNLQYPEKDYGFSNHMVFAGDPGTGKTTVAKLVAKALYEIGAIPENKCTEVAASQLIKGYVGQTGEHVEAVMQEALGGIIFIDEAYELMVKDGQNSFNNDALAVLLRYMEDHRRDLVVIAAGYEKEMREFLASNIGLTRRFQWVSFEDYTASEMADIFMLMCERLDETFAIDDPHSVLEDCFAHLTGYYLSHPDPKGRVTNGGNGGLARNLFQQVIFARNNRIAETSNTTMQILQSDIQCGLAEEMHKAMSVI
jgi:SpoVK/Ycf46/Vps4 family AAA+-type ATPase